VAVVRFALTDSYISAISCEANASKRRIETPSSSLCTAQWAGTDFPMESAPAAAVTVPGLLSVR